MIGQVFSAPSASVRFIMDGHRFSNSGLNEQQQAAVLKMDGPILILAGPGSGKTRVITHRIAQMIASGVPSHSITALTFTNKAADEMKKRLANMVSDHHVWAGTFHRFCSRLLRAYAGLIGLKENFSIFDSDDSKKLIKQAIANTKVNLRHYAPDRIATEIHQLKNSAIPSERFQARPGHYVDVVVAKVYPEYQKLLSLANGVDFDDLLLHVVELLRHSPDLRESLDRRNAYMLVDEYQDTNTAQYQIIHMLNSSVQNLTATGDPDQSIYGWRGANINNILDFERDYPNASVFRLEQNYRSTKSILAVADQLIANNSRRRKKTLFTDNEAGNPVRLVSYSSPEDEAANIVETIARAIYRQERRASDFAIFYRTNYLSRVLEHAFRRRGVPYQILRGFEFYQRKEVKDLLAYLHLINNPADSVAFERVINVPPRKIGKVTISRLQDYARERSMSLADAARQCDQISTIAAASASKIKQFADMLDRLALAADQDVATLMQQVIAETGYRTWLELDGTDEAAERIANLDELITAAEEFERDFGDEGGLERYLEQASLVSDTDSWDASAEYVSMMSLHAAKGLEFPCVFIVGLEEGILPHERNLVEEEKVEEERRLFFVGITRAISELQISRCLNRFRRGSSWPAIPSRFLMELPRHEMQVFEPSSYGHEENYEDLMKGVGPFMNDGLPSIDINDDYESTEFKPAFKPKSPSHTLAHDADGFELEIQLDESHDDDASAGTDRLFESTTHYQVGTRQLPITMPTSKSKGGVFPRLKTAAQFAQEQESSETTQLHPGAYQQGMRVEHPEYGTGEIVNLSGEGKRRMATIDFPGQGKKRFHLASAKLKPVNRGAHTEAPRH